MFPLKQIILIFEYSSHISGPFPIWKLISWPEFPLSATKENGNLLLSLDSSQSILRKTLPTKLIMSTPPSLLETANSLISQTKPSLAFFITILLSLHDVFNQDCIWTSKSPLSSPLTLIGPHWGFMNKEDIKLLTFLTENLQISIFSLDIQVFTLLKATRHAH